LVLWTIRKPPKIAATNLVTRPAQDPIITRKKTVRMIAATNLVTRPAQDPIVTRMKTVRMIAATNLVTRPAQDPIVTSRNTIRIITALAEANTQAENLVTRPVQSAITGKETVRMTAAINLVTRPAQDPMVLSRNTVRNITALAEANTRADNLVTRAVQRAGTETVRIITALATADIQADIQAARPVQDPVRVVTVKGPARRIMALAEVDTQADNLVAVHIITALAKADIRATNLVTRPAQDPIVTSRNTIRIITALTTDIQTDNLVTPPVIMGKEAVRMIAATNLVTRPAQDPMVTSRKTVRIMVALVEANIQADNPVTVQRAITGKETVRMLTGTDTDNPVTRTVQRVEVLVIHSTIRTMRQTEATTRCLRLLRACSQRREMASKLSSLENIHWAS